MTWRIQPGVRLPSSALTPQTTQSIPSGTSKSGGLRDGILDRARALAQGTPIGSSLEVYSLMLQRRMGGSVTSIEILKTMLEAEGKSPAEIIVDEESCLGEDKCGRCNDTCAIVANCFALSIRDEVNRYFCIECQACMTACPKEAIEITGRPPLSPLSEEKPSFETVLRILKERRSGRAFKIAENGRARTLTPMEKSGLQMCFEASPIGHMNEYLRLVYVETPEVLEAISGACMESWFKMAKFVNIPVADTLARKNVGAHSYPLFQKMGVRVDEQRALYETVAKDPVTFLGNVMLITAPNEKMAEYETGIASAYIMLGAMGLGLETCLSGVIKAMQGDVKKVLKRYGHDLSGLNIQGAIIIGEPAFKRRGVPTRNERPVTVI